MLKIGIIGTRGIPNNYGGFEQFAEYLAQGLVIRGHEITVYNSHDHPYKESLWNGVRIVHCYDPEEKLGAVGQFIYDFRCILDARKRAFDVILQLGYTSSSVWGWLLPRRNTTVTTNMDGIEWKRSKYSKPVQSFLKFAEYLAVVFSDHLISDSLGVRSYLQEKYNKNSVYIPYGAHQFLNPDPTCLDQFGVKVGKFDMLIARLEPENNIEMILDGVSRSNIRRIFLVIGKHQTKFGEYLKERYLSYPHIIFCGGVYDIDVLNNLRFHSHLYFHGHSVGGTNPSLLEAMASGAIICAHRNIFNQSILGEDSFYFASEEDVSQIIEVDKYEESEVFINNNWDKIETKYNWDIIIDQYEAYFKSIVSYEH